MNGSTLGGVLVEGSYGWASTVGEGEVEVFEGAAFALEVAEPKAVGGCFTEELVDSLGGCGIEEQAE
jgi:hypothetical protein